ncbi:MAG: M18 family aminopeptidase [Deltaproteobacteria bacterium]|nr:M18 family aminopeptidase [Deltaproteobacteria bacterium]
MNNIDLNKQLFSYLHSSPTPFHAVANIQKYLLSHNFSQLYESDKWHLKQGQSYFVLRDNGAVIAFTLGLHEPVTEGFRMLAAHTDSPALQIKPKPSISEGSFLNLGVEIYGGALLNSWFDRDLSLAGRVCCETGNGSLEIMLIDFKRTLLTIPSVAIHLDREANEKKTVHRQNHMPPILAQDCNNNFPDFNAFLSAQLQRQYPAAKIKEILSFDIFCYDTQPPTYTGLNNEMLSGSRLDNLLSCFVGMSTLAAAGNNYSNMLICTNHEENGSVSASGASGAFTDAVLERIAPDPVRRRITLHNSFLISMDNSHATHPNFKEKTDPAHLVLLNKGPVIKINANQRYATNSISSAVFKNLCKKIEVTPQEFVMRSDMTCGSTVGPMTAARLGLKTVDIGVPSLAMHSIREHTGAEDPLLLYRTIMIFLQTESSAWNLHNVT